MSLNAGEGLAEGTHFLFFPNNIVGVLYNFHGPSVRRFTTYLLHKFNLDVSFIPVYRRDVLQILEALATVSKLEMSIPANQVHLLAGPTDDADDDFAAPLAQGARLLEDGNIRLEVSVGQGAPQNRYDRAKTLAKRFARRDDLDRFRVAKVYGRLEDESDSLPIDLKSEQLITKKDVEPETPRSTRVRQSSASAAVRQAYQEYRPHIRTVTETMPALTSALPIGDINPTESSEPTGSEE